MITKIIWMWTKNELWAIMCIYEQNVKKWNIIMNFFKIKIISGNPVFNALFDPGTLKNFRFSKTSIWQHKKIAFSKTK